MSDAAGSLSAVGAEADAIAAAFARKHALRERARRARGDWAALTLAR